MPAFQASSGIERADKAMLMCRALPIGGGIEHAIWAHGVPTSARRSFAGTAACPQQLAVRDSQTINQPGRIAEKHGVALNNRHQIPEEMFWPENPTSGAISFVEAHHSYIST